MVKAFPDLRSAQVPVTKLVKHVVPVHPFASPAPLFGGILVIFIIYEVHFEVIEKAYRVFDLVVEILLVSGLAGKVQVN